MPRNYQTKFYRLQMPDAWQVSGDGERVVTLFRPDGVGMLRILTVEEEQPSAAGSDRIFRSPLPEAAREFRIGTNFSRSWTLLCRGRKVYVRYSCAASFADLERSEVDEIIQSISENDDDVA
jgi:hypothetical protein